MTTVHIITGLGRGGAETSLLKLLEASDELRRGARVVSLKDDGPIGRDLERLGIPVDVVGIRGIRSLPSAVRAAAELSVGPPPSLIQGWMYHGNVAASLWSLAGEPSIPVLWNVRHSLDTLEHEKATTRTILRLSARASGSTSGVIYNSRVAATQHEAIGYDSERTEVITNGFDTARYHPDPERRARFRERHGISDDVTIIGHVGRFHPIKGHALFAEAGSRLLGRRSKLHFVMAGRGLTWENERIANLMRHAGLQDDVTLLDEVRDTAELMPALDILCSSSFGEGLPNVVGEAMAAGVACVVTRVGDSAWLVDDTGVVVEPEVPALTAGLERLVAIGPAGREALGRVARARIARLFSVSAMVDGYSSLYEKVQSRVGKPVSSRQSESGIGQGRRMDVDARP